jgi:uncharacterized membrane protein
MKKTIGIILILVGIAAILIETVGFTHEETVVEVGPIEVTRDKEEMITVPAVAGVIAIVGGVALLAWGGRTGN